MRAIKIKDKEFVPFVTEAEIDAIVRRLASEVSSDYAGLESGVVVCPVLTGAYMFAADLVRRLTVDAEVRFVKYSSYEGMESTGKVCCQLPFTDVVQDRDVLIVEDVIDTGISMQRLLDDVRRLGAKSVKVCTLFFKPGSFRGDYRVDYVGKEIGEEIGLSKGHQEELDKNITSMIVFQLAENVSAKDIIRMLTNVFKISVAEAQQRLKAVSAAMI